MLETIIQEQFLRDFCDVNPPFSGSIAEWSYQHVKLPDNYSIPGRCDFTTSPWLLAPLEAVQNPKVRMVVKAMAIQLAKSTTDEAGAIPYWISQAPGPILRIHQDDVAANVAMETRLVPVLKNTSTVAPLLSNSDIKKGLIRFPHMFIRIAGDKESVAHGLSIRYLVLDDAHLFDFGIIEKFIGRTNAFAGRRKIIISAQPNRAGSELEKYYQLGKIFEWHWQCPSCKQHQPFYWYKQRIDGTYAGMNWDTILNDDGETTNIAQSARTAWLECFHCKHQVHDNVTNRRQLNDGGKYVCIKQDGDPEVLSYTCPAFVNINLSFESFVIQYLTAKQMQRNTTLDEDIVTFVNQVLGKFYKADPTADHSRILRGEYDLKEDANKDWLRVLSVDCQRKGLIKYYVVRDWKKDGSESRRIAFGIVRSYEEVELLRLKYNVRIPCVVIDSGDGVQTTIIYQECVKHGKPYRLDNGIVGYDCWCPAKGDQKLKWDHDGIGKYYSPISRQDPCFPIGSKFKGIFAPLILWSNYSIKSILMSLRDQKIPGIKWLVDSKDADYENQMYSEGLKEVVDKRTGQKGLRWIQIGEDNHFLDCEAQSLMMAIRANCFSATTVNEKELEAIIPKEVKKS